MAGIGLLLPIALLTGLFFWFRASRGEAPPQMPSRGRFSLLTEAVGYVGGLLMFAGGVAALVQRWDDLSAAVRVGLLAGSALVLLAIGFATMRSSDPAAIRLTSVLWLLSTAATAGAVAELMTGVVEASDETSFLVTAAVATLWASVVYALHRLTLQHLALFVGVLVTALAAIQRIDPEAPGWIAGVVAWAIGLGWVALGEGNLVPPWWAAIPVGMLTALIAPTAVDADSTATMFALGIGTAALLMAFSVRGKLVPGLALASLGLFAYVTGAVVHYLGDPLGVPMALTLTGGLILVIAGITARLARFTRPPRLKAS